jgi:hypothetical protein
LVSTGTRHRVSKQKHHGRNEERRDGQKKKLAGRTPIQSEMSAALLEGVKGAMGVREVGK